MFKIMRFFFSNSLSQSVDQRKITLPTSSTVSSALFNTLLTPNPRAQKVMGVFDIKTDDTAPLLSVTKKPLNGLSF